MKSNKLLVKNIPQKEVIETLKAKPTSFLLALLVLSVTLTFSNNYYRLNIGLILLAISVFSLIILPERIVLAFYQNYMVIYNEVEKEYCNLIYYDEILSYRYVRNKRYDLLIIKTLDEEVYELQCFNKNKVLSFMHDFAKDKEIVNGNRLLAGNKK